MKPSQVIRRLAWTKHREAIFAKCGLQDFTTCSLAALMIDIYLDGSNTLLVNCHYDGRNERGHLVKMGMAKIVKTDQRGTNYKILNAIILTPKGIAIAKKAVEQIDKIMNKVNAQKV